VAVGSYVDESLYVLQGESLSVVIDGVAGGVDSNFSAFIMDDANFSKWIGGQSSNWCVGNNAITAGTVLNCATPSAGWFHIVYFNPSNNFASRTVTRHRPMTKWEVTYYQSKAIFEELRARGLIYINLPGTGFFSSSQNVRYPVESLSYGANCIDGSLLFASAWEALGMEPILAVSFTAGHAFVAVRCWSGANCIVPVETTMVGGSASFGDAYDAAATNWNSWATGGHLQQVDMKAARTAGLTPAPM
jgi:hypothetical protein